MNTELANALMRAEAAEALLEELRQECEALRQDNEQLQAALADKKPAEPEPTGTDLAYQRVQSLMREYLGGDYLEKDLRRVWDQTFNAERRRNKLTKGKAYAQSIPYTLPRKNIEHFLEVSVERFPESQSVRIELRVATGQAACVELDARELADPLLETRLIECASYLLRHLDLPTGSAISLARQIEQQLKETRW